jgi:YD repeat-containing protein
MTRVAGYLVASMADDAAKQLRQNKAVLYLQRVGEPEAAGSPRRRVEAEAMHVRATPEYTAPTWSSGAYTYDGAGNITAIGTAVSKSSDDRTNTYVYDANSRLTGWTDSTLTSPEAYTYDVYGNMTAVTRHTGMTIAFDVDTATNHVPRGTYDDAGNLRQDDSSRTYTYDSENMIAQSTSSTEGTSYYVYGPDDERVGVLASNPQWTWTWSGKVLWSMVSGAHFRWLGVRNDAVAIAAGNSVRDFALPGGLCWDDDARSGASGYRRYL